MDAPTGRMARSLTQREDWTRDLGGCLTARWRNDPSPPFLLAQPVVNDLLTLPLAQRLDGFLADGELRVETLHSGSIRLKVYGVERTLVDCFRHCRRLGMAPVLEALKDAINQRRLNVNELWRQAQAQRMQRVMTPELEALL